jgi:hypothetical protein
MSEHGIQALDELRESLREAARRDIAARPRRRWSRKRFGGLAAVLVVFAGGAAATAANLISEGEPLPPRPHAARYQSLGGRPVRLDVRAKDSPLPWGVAVYTANNGQRCALAGQLRGYTLGRIRGTTFHPYPDGQEGSCGRPRKLATPITRSFIRGNGRTIFYGLAGTGTKAVSMTVDGRSHTAPVGARGAFIFVFKGESVPDVPITAS